MKFPGLGVKQTRNHMPALSLTSSVTLDKSLNFSQPQFPHPQKKNNSSTQFLWLQ